MDQALFTLKLQTYSWISDTFGSTDKPNRTLRRKVKPGTTIYTLFTELANQYPEFRKNIFDPNTGRLNDQVMVIINSRLIQSTDMKDVEVQDKDNIILSPVLVGG